MKPSLNSLLLITCICATSIAASGAEGRKCTDPHGKLLYVVSSNGRVTDAHGKLLGEVKGNGDVLDAHGQLIARGGDAGLLLTFARPH